MNSRRIQLVALDLDETTLRSDKTLSERTRAAMIAACQAGIHVVVASGRPYSALPQAILEIPGIRYAITSNGAAIYDLSTGERCYEALLNGDSVEKILQLLPEDTVYETFIQGKPYAEGTFVRDPAAYGLNPNGVAYIQASRTPVDDMAAFIREHRNELDSIDVITSGREEAAEILQLLGREIRDIYMTASVSRLLEIAHASAGKHEAVRWLCERLDIPVSCAAAFGDGENDREMLEMVGLGVAMGNAEPQVKEAADCVTDTNNRDGVAKVLWELIP